MRPRPAIPLLAAALALAGALAPAACSGDDDGSPGDGSAGGDGSPSGAADGAPLGAFESFRHSSAGGLCPDDMDCSGFVELTADRVLLVDKIGELPAVVHQTEVTADELAGAVPVLTDPDLVALLDLGEPPCLPPTDIFEDMTLLEGGGRHHTNSVALCDDPPIAAARTTLAALASAYFP